MKWVGYAGSGAIPKMYFKQVQELCEFEKIIYGISENFDLSFLNTKEEILKIAIENPITVEEAISIYKRILMESD